MGDRYPVRSRPGRRLDEAKILRPEVAREMRQLVQDKDLDYAYQMRKFLADSTKQSSLEELIQKLRGGDLELEEYAAREKALEKWVEIEKARL